MKNSLRGLTAAWNWQKKGEMYLKERSIEIIQIEE